MNLIDELIAALKKAGMAEKTIALHMEVLSDFGGFACILEPQKAIELRRNLENSSFLVDLEENEGRTRVSIYK